MLKSLSLKSINFLLITTIVFLGGMLLFEKYAFPIKYKVCDTMYSNCSTIAKFKDMDSCETTKEKWSWYCDTVTNPIKPDCRVGKSLISTSICTE
jgi:hypothetical protein